jgi:hypothetical protein
MPPRLLKDAVPSVLMSDSPALKTPPASGLMSGVVLPFAAVLFATMAPSSIMYVEGSTSMPPPPDAATLLVMVTEMKFALVIGPIIRTPPPLADAGATVLWA